MTPLALIAALITLAGPPTPTLTLQSRDIRQVQGDWSITYVLLNPTGTTIHIDPRDLTAHITASLSNSAVPGHDIPRAVVHDLQGSSSSTTFAEVIAGKDDATRCRERLAIEIWTGGVPPDEVDHVGGVVSLEGRNIVPLDTLTVRLRMDHDHELYGPLDPLLGTRSITMHVGRLTIRDTVPMAREQYRALPRGGWGPIPEDHRDDKMFWSAPDSLRLDATEAGESYFRWPERKLRYATKYRLSFRYFLVGGCDGKLMARVAQYRESPNAWRPLSGGSWESELKEVGRWVKVDRVFFSEDQATTFALDFRIANADQGVAFIDDVACEAVESHSDHP